MMGDGTMASGLEHRARTQVPMPPLTPLIQNLPAAKRPLPNPAITINLNSIGHAINLQFLSVLHLYKNDIFTKCLPNLYFYVFKIIPFPLRILLFFPTPMFSCLPMNTVSETRVKTS